MSLQTTAGRAALIAATASLLAACGSSAAAPGSNSPAVSGGNSPATSASSSNSTQPQRDPTSTATAGRTLDAAKAPATAKMVCSDDIRANIGKLLHLSPAPRGKATWDGTRYVCRYQLPQGRLVLTVHQSADAAAAKTYLRNRQQAVHATPITGAASLGLPAFETRTGTAAFAKDNFTLVVDASRLSGTLGDSDNSRSDVAYTLGTDVLACWSHD